MIAGSFTQLHIYNTLISNSYVSKAKNAKEINLTIHFLLFFPFFNNLKSVSNFSLILSDSKQSKNQLLYIKFNP